MVLPAVEFLIVPQIGNVCLGPADMQSSANEAGIDVQPGFAGIGRKTAGVEQGAEIVDVREFTTTVPEVFSLRRYFIDSLREDGLSLRGTSIRRHGI
jgi:hypothetical protein